MTHEEATARSAQLNRDRGAERHWFPKRTERGDWEVVSVKSLRGTEPWKATVQAKPRPEDPPDPRPAIFRNIPPFGPG